MFQINSGTLPGMVDHGRFSRREVMRELQDGDQWVYALLTRQGAIKLGVTTDLATRSTRSIRLGGTWRVLAFRPGDYGLERDLHQSLTPHRILGYREYYYPAAEVLAKANWMREWWGVKPINRHHIPRLAECTFHAEVMQREAAQRRQQERDSA